MSEWDGWYYASQSAQLLLAGWWWNLALERYYLVLVCDRPSHGEQDSVSLLSILIILCISSVYNLSSDSHSLFAV